MFTRVFTGLLFSLLTLIASANAGEEQKCSRQYSLEQHLILEWAALGGDPHAQFALTQCAFPRGGAKLSEPEQIYALRWLTLASCEALSDKETLKRNARTRQLKERGDLSFRRFGGEADEEKLSTRDKMFLQYRTRKTDELRQRQVDIDKLVSDEIRRKANDELIEQFTGMGELGLLRLAQLSSCSYFDTTKEFTAASWAAAQDQWKTSTLSKVTGKSEKRGWSIAKQSDKHHKALSTLERKTASFEKARITNDRPQRIAQLEQRAALADMQNLSTAHAHASESGAPSKTVTLALQYALEALGMLEFVNGPDNDYGPTTIEAVRKLQASWGADETRWLNHEQTRQTICQAATKAADPVSMYNVALMHANGWGFKQDYNKARYAIDRAEKAMKVRLEKAVDLADWKQLHYPRYVAEIEAEKALIHAAWSALPVRDKTTPDETTICR